MFAEVLNINKLGEEFHLINKIMGVWRLLLLHELEECCNFALANEKQPVREKHKNKS